MNTIVTEKGMSFKVFEQEMFQWVCLLGRECTRAYLESYDDMLAQSRDRAAYRDKGRRKTTIKTVYGEVEYSRRVYKASGDGGGFVYLLDGAMGMDMIGHMSTNLAEKIAAAAATVSYREAASLVSTATGQTVSHGGVWGVVQAFGERVNREEDVLVSEMDAGVTRGSSAVGVLFEEMDGVWLKMQGKAHERLPGRELKVGVTYEGYRDGRLEGLDVTAGMCGAAVFHKKREARIRSVYDADEITMRVLGGDGGGWIRDPYEPDTVFQLDRFHIYRAIRGYVRDGAAQTAVRELLDAGRIEEMFDYISIYADSVGSLDPQDKAAGNAMKLYGYLNANREGLLPWRERGPEIPDPPEGMEYRNLGVMEGQNCSVITLRMKNRRARWSERGADSMAKVLCAKANGELSALAERFTDGLVYAEKPAVIKEVLSAAKAPRKDGSGSIYMDIVNRHLPFLDAKRTEARKALRRAFA